MTTVRFLMRLTGQTGKALSKVEPPSITLNLKSDLIAQGIKIHEGGTVSQKLFEEWELAISGASPEEKAQWLVEKAQIDALFRNGYEIEWNEAIEYRPCCGIRWPYSGYHEKIFRGKVNFTDPQSKAYLRACLDPGGKKISFVGWKTPAFRQLAKAITVPDSTLAALAREQFRHARRADVLIDKLCPIISQNPRRKYSGAKEQKAVAHAFDDLQVAFIRKPGLWILMPKSEAARSVAIDHQLFPFYDEFFRWWNAIEKAAIVGIDVADDIKKLRAMYTQGRSNWISLRNGCGLARHRDEILSEVIGENVKTTVLYAKRELPDEQRFIFDEFGKPRRTLIADTEAKFLSVLEDQIARIEKLCPKNRLLKTLSTHLPSEESSRPSKVWIKNIENELDDNLRKDLLIGILSLTSKTFDDVMDEFSKADFDLRVIDQYNANRRLQKAIVWAAHLLGPSVLHLLNEIALQSYAKIPGVGPKDEKLGNAAAWSMASISGGEGIPSLIQLKDTTNFPHIQTRLDEIITTAKESSSR